MRASQGALFGVPVCSLGKAHNSNSFNCYRGLGSDADFAGSISGTIEAGVLFNHTWTRSWRNMALRAVVFDYGMVLTGPQDPEGLSALLRMTGLPPNRFEELYWADRHAYDEGKLTGLAFWQKFLRAAGLSSEGGASPSEAGQLD